MTDPQQTFQQPTKQADTYTESMRGFNGFAEAAPKAAQQRTYDIDSSSMRGFTSSGPLPKK